LGDTLAQIAEQFDISLEALRHANTDLTTLIPGAALLIPAPTPLPLLIRPPTCSETRPGVLLCLGRVDNPLDFPVEQVAVVVRLLDLDGSVYKSVRSTIEQTSIPSGGFAPYQAQFSADWNGFAGVDAHLVSAAQGSPDQFVPLLIEDVQGEQIDGRMILSAEIENQGEQDAELLRAVVTFADPFGQVIGYRVVVFETGLVLAMGARQPLRLELAPPPANLTPEYALYVEARAKAQ
jgi:hypothetical protein